MPSTRRSRTRRRGKTMRRRGVGKTTRCSRGGGPGKPVVRSTPSKDNKAKVYDAEKERFLTTTNKGKSTDPKTPRSTTSHVRRSGPGKATLKAKEQRLLWDAEEEAKVQARLRQEYLNGQQTGSWRVTTKPSPTK